MLNELALWFIGLSVLAVNVAVMIVLTLGPLALFSFFVYRMVRGAFDGYTREMRKSRGLESDRNYIDRNTHQGNGGR